MRSGAKWGWLLTAIVLASGAGCKKDESHDDHESSRESHARGEHAKAGSAEVGVVAIDPEMVRDLRVKTAEVESRPAGEGVSLLGELQVDEDAYAQVGAPITARVMRVMAAAGDVVKEGAPLAELESVDLGKARATETSARARAELARQVATRKRQLVAERIAASRELEEAEDEAKAADAELRAARGTLKALGAAGEGAGDPGEGNARFVLRSPVPGTVLERKLARGQVVHPDDALFRVADLKTLWLTVHAFERDALRVKPGTIAGVTFPALPGRNFSGKVAWVGSQVDVASRTIPVRVIVASEGLLRPGMSGTAFLTIGDSAGTTVAVPAAALQRLERDWVVFLPSKRQNSFEIRSVGRGRDLGGEVEIVSNLKPGETVVVDGAFLIKAEAEKARGMGEQHEH
jgi:cobalt-zinc-cadmium efflux system membrane fusion protein